MGTSAQQIDPRVVAIRQDPRVGRGTCTSIDECYSDSELASHLDSAGVTTGPAAVNWAHEEHGLYLEMGLNYSSGEPDCPLRKAYNDWQENKA